MADFLFEIGLEEVPARMIASAERELLDRTVGLLERERLIPLGTRAGLQGTSKATHPKEWHDCASYSTPRRLAVLISDVASQQEDVTEEVLGPATKIAFKDGQPGPAALAFAKKAGVDVLALRTVTNAKGEYVAATSVKAGRSAAEVIAEELPKEIAGIYWAKNMYWREGKPERFVRPVRWLVALLGDEVVPVLFGGYEASNVTYGHRILFGDQPIAVTPANYVEELKKAKVRVLAGDTKTPLRSLDHESRLYGIRKALDSAREKVEGARWRENPELLEKMTHMTEWPSVILGGFEKEYLALPEEVLVTVMRDHQNYFAVETADGKLAPHFLAVLNTVADEAGQAVIRHGNERVLRARFNDARFFWEFDQRVGLVDRIELLRNVTFQKDLGSYFDKSERVTEICRRLEGLVKTLQFNVDFNGLINAARLAKTDLTTELVKEFTELQGTVGGLYAQHQKIKVVAWDAISDQYRPQSMEDDIPRSVEGQILAIADKIDTIAGMFGLGLQPTGSKDPFALRRAANGIVKILAESKIPLTLGQITRAAKGENPELVLAIETFLAERLEFYLREAKGQAYDVVAAVLRTGANDVKDAVARAEALTIARGSSDFLAVSAAFKRMKNILVQAEQAGFFETKSEPSANVSIHPAQNALQTAATQISGVFADLAANHQYVAALEAIATLRPQIDQFFEQVMVMDPDPYIKRSRLGLLSGIVQTFSAIADFSEIVTAG